ncbi:MAG: hypothetical protein HYU66_03065, partial [Armatimonadetes bacterium]|nr:hypothetical protein [Armatimonadota bacterium]
IEFDAGGTYTLRVGEPEMVFTGTFRLNPDGTATFVLPNDDEPGNLSIHRIDADTIDLVDEEGATYHIVRQGSTAEVGTHSITVVRPGGQRPPGPEPQRLRLEPRREAREQAFTILVPKGWALDGGVLRLPAQTYGARNAASANIDVSLHDPQGRAMLWSYPMLVYCDASATGTAAQFPVGTICDGAISLMKMDPGAYVSQVLFTKLRPKAQNAKLVDQTELPDLASIQENIDQMMGMEGFTVTAAMHTVEYDEDGVHYRERLLAVVDDSGPAGNGIWRVTQAVGMRAPAADFDRLSAVLGASWISLQWNPAWRDREMRQTFQNLGVQVPAGDLEHLAVLDQDATVNTADEIFLALFDEAPGVYSDPFGKDDDAEIMGSSYWQRRWQAPTGEVIYSGAGYDPAKDPDAKAAGFKACPAIDFAAEP